jgi:fumarate reductase subunit D
VSHDAIFVSDGQVNQLIISVYLDRVQAVLELGTKASAEAITLLSIGVSVIARVLIKVIEILGIWSTVRVP